MINELSSIISNIFDKSYLFKFYPNTINSTNITNFFISQIVFPWTAGKTHNRESTGCKADSPKLKFFSSYLHFDASKQKIQLWMYPFWLCQLVTYSSDVLCNNILGIYNVASSERVRKLADEITHQFIWFTSIWNLRMDLSAFI